MNNEGNIINLDELAEKMIKDETTSLEIVYRKGKAEIVFNFSIKEASIIKENGEKKIIACTDRTKY